MGVGCCPSPEASRLTKPIDGSSLDWQASAQGRGDLTHNVERPSQQLGKRPDGPGKTKGPEPPQLWRATMRNHFLVRAGGTLTGGARRPEVMPR
jgi:hypothetical protein